MGRQKKKHFSEALDSIASQEMPSHLTEDQAHDLFNLLIPEEMIKRGLTYIEVMAFHLISRGVNGDVKAIQEIIDRMEGKPKQTSENVNMTISYEDFLEEIATREEEQSGVLEAPPGGTLVEAPPEKSTSELLDELGLL